MSRLRRTAMGETGAGLAVRALLVIGMVALAGCSTTYVKAPDAPNPGTRPPASTTSVPTTPAATPACRECGVIQRIDTVPAGRTVSTAKGPVLGGIVGGVASRDVPKEGGTSGPARDTYNIHVRLQDGRDIVINQAGKEGLRTQMRVRVIKGRVVPE